jgi:long-subunit acyl-CoA synthetase (AMP-forming)
MHLLSFIPIANSHPFSPTVQQIGKVQSILSFDASPEYMHSYKRWMALVADEPPAEPTHPLASDVATIIYTSGTTGTRKKFS